MDFEVTFEHVSQIPVNLAGKRRLIINELSALTALFKLIMHTASD